MSVLENDDIMSDIKTAMSGEEPEVQVDDVEEFLEPQDQAVSEGRERDEGGRFKKKEESAEEVAVEQPVKKFDAPTSYPANMKEKWATLPPELQEYLSSREADIHRNMTAQDGDLRMGRELKEVITPYMAIIQAEGGTPAGAVRDLLNTAYQLRTGSPMQKAALLHQVAQQYGVDMGAYQPQNQQHNQNLQWQNQFQQFQQQVNPETIKNQLRKEMEKDRINSEVNAFKSDPKNVHFEQVRTAMGSLLDSGRAKDLQDAYDQACWADPTIRSTLLAKQQAEEQAKRKAENDAKRKAGASVNGSVTASPAPKAPTNSIEDDIRAALRESSGMV